MTGLNCEVVSMRILVVGDGHSAIHEVAVADAFKELGHEVKSFYWHTYFNTSNPVISVWRRAQNKFLVGAVINRLNSDLIKKSLQFSPKLIFIYRGTHISPNAIREIKRQLPDCMIYGYNNDDPFAQGHPPWLWRHFLKSVPLYDIVFAYRHHNLNDFVKIGAKRVELLRSWFISSKNHPVCLTDTDKALYCCDVVFIGHFEDDGRLECLEELAKIGIKLNLFGPPYEWNHRLAKSPILKHLAPVRLVWNDEYNKALCGAKIALCFFSKLNRDTYTRRCFEIPATRTLLLSEYSSDISSIYRAGEDADFFENKADLIKKVQFYLENESLRNKVALSGFLRVCENGHDNISRMKNVLQYLELNN